MSIYTKKGDKGYTSLPDGKELLKNHLLIEVLGSLEELNAGLGVARTGMKVWPEKQNIPHRSNLTSILKQIQGEIFHVSSLISDTFSTGSDTSPINIKQRTNYWEKVIDGIETQLPQVKNFILPGGSRVAAFLFLTRTTCRRAERNMVSLAEEYKKEVFFDIIEYLNRLGDLLFILARLINKLRNAKETIWNGAWEVLQQTQQQDDESGQQDFFDEPDGSGN